MKIILTGSQGTGKSTILSHYQKLGYNCITEIVRNLAKTGIKINELGDKDSQEIIYKTYQELFNESNNYISDRGLTDVCSYTYHLSKTNPELIPVYNHQIEGIKEFMENNPGVKFFYFPIEFPVVDDGVRSTDEKFRMSIDESILNILKECKIPYIEVRGTVDERINIINEYVK